MFCEDCERRSVRVSFARNSAGSHEVTGTNNYDPFGLNHIGGGNISPFSGYHSYKFGGKEIQETGMYDFGARIYMPDIARWGVIDPLAEMMRRYSPYNYAFNNPVSFVDPDGMAPRQFAMPTDTKPDAPSGWINPNWIGRGGAQFGSIDTAYSGYGSGGGNGNYGSDDAIYLNTAEGIMFGLSYFGEGRSVETLFEFIKQLKKVGIEDPVNGKPAFTDHEKIMKTGFISDVAGRLFVAGNTSADSKIFFKETNSFLYKGKSNGFEILISMKNISSPLEYAYIIGHELNHSITHYFQETFYDTIKSNKNNRTSRDAFGYFNEYISYSWETKMGNPNISNSWDYTYRQHGAERIPANFRYSQSSIMRVQDNLNNLMRAYMQFYNNLKK
ncbi:RHS repeat domain-containing protein [Chryseobacterium pennipullorum]|uniref:RHS repeat-associated core domain-containing protein n=1 Tax=Chryseobacterium pennipullorum TaxID=2258963 RepID=A0A3D9B9W2_9FLAO|nr:RHS repeat-associated core domain-containing protein [Chryseobacterium pennipullorum]REC50403.1 hypothetical protein DRF67_02425 [Chryseobacterium pennipullorum]